MNIICPLRARRAAIRFTGRHKGLKTPRLHGRAGSIPALDTILYMKASVVYSAGAFLWVGVSF